MKKTLIILSFTFSLFAQPPSTPLPLPKECKTIPPMIIFLPKPMEKELIPCKNIVFQPTLAMVKQKFPKATAIYPTEGFERLYTIKFENNETIFCNKDLSTCIKGTLLHKNIH